MSTNSAPYAVSQRPLVGVAAVLLGSVISTLYGRISVFGLADIRGAVHAGVDDGAWITTAFTVGQMLMGVTAVWLGAVFGPRRVLMAGMATAAVACFCIPFVPVLPAVIALQAIAGLGSGTFIPLTISFVLRNLKPEWRVFGIAAYAMSLELSLNVPASLEGFYVDHWGWQWIFWQQVILAPPMLLLVHFGMPRVGPNRALLRGFDVPGVIYLGAGASFAVAALDQADRLDWLHSGLICGLFAAAALLLTLFVVRELTTPTPFFHLGFATSGNLPKLAALLMIYRFAILATALVIPQYLTRIQHYRALEIGQSLVWIAIPQVVLAPLTAVLIKRTGARLVMAVGFTAIGAACLMVAHGLTSDWATGDFLPSQLLQALGQTMTLTGFVTFATRHLVADKVLTFGAFLQTFRLLGGQIGTATMTWFVRAHEQIHSAILGGFVVRGAPMTAMRLQMLRGAMTPRADGAPEAAARAGRLLGQAVRDQAFVLSYIDAMVMVAGATAVALLIAATLRRAPAASP